MRYILLKKKKRIFNLTRYIKSHFVNMFCTPLTGFTFQTYKILRITFMRSYSGLNESVTNRDFHIRSQANLTRFRIVLWQSRNFIAPTTLNVGRRNVITSMCVLSISLRFFSLANISMSRNTPKPHVYAPSNTIVCHNKF